MKAKQPKNHGALRLTFYADSMREREAVILAARRAGLTVSAYVRAAVLEKMKGGKR